MCTNQYLISNRYMRRPMYVKCGHCKACLQEKANARQRRIRNTEKKGLVCLLVSLTYKRFNAPYILRDEAYDFSQGVIDKLNVYRDISYRKVRCPKSNDNYFQDYKIKRETHVLETIDFIKPVSLSGTKDMKHEFGRIGVCYYPDYQGFVARLRLNIERHYGKKVKLYIYACSEYGSVSLRPHFHLLIFCEIADKEIVKDAIYESWPFSNLRRFKRSVEESYNASSYVASYVNSGSRFPSFFKVYLCQKHSYSKGFGLNHRNFTLAKILEMFERGSFKYSVLKNVRGVSVPINVPLPAYVIHRYFPKFKGYSRLSPCSLVTYMLRLASGVNPYDLDGSLLKGLPFPTGYENEAETFLYWSDEEVHKISVCLNNAYSRFCADYPYQSNVPTFEDYCYLHKKVWNCFNSTLLRFQMEDTNTPLYEHFDNLDTYIYAPDSLKDAGLHLLVDNGINPNDIITCNPNEFKSVERSTADAVQRFNDHIKHRNVRNTIYNMDDDCEI